MVRPAFQNLAVDFWVHPGRLGTAQLSLCLFHATAATGAQLRDALTELKGDGAPAQRILTFARCGRKSPLGKLKLLLVPRREYLRVMNIRRTGTTAEVEMTEHGLELMLEAVSSWLAGSEDFGVSAGWSSIPAKQLGRLDRESGELWFWGPGYSGP